MPFSLIDTCNWVLFFLCRCLKCTKLISVLLSLSRLVTLVGSCAQLMKLSIVSCLVQEWDRNTCTREDWFSNPKTMTLTQTHSCTLATSGMNGLQPKSEGDAAAIDGFGWPHWSQVSWGAHALSDGGHHSVSRLRRDGCARLERNPIGHLNLWIGESGGEDFNMLNSRMSSLGWIWPSLLTKIYAVGFTQNQMTHERENNRRGRRVSVYFCAWQTFSRPTWSFRKC